MVSAWNGILTHARGPLVTSLLSEQSKDGLVFNSAGKETFFALDIVHSLSAIGTSASAGAQRQM